MKLKKHCPRFLLSIAFVLILSMISHADTLVSINDLSYHSAFEERVFHDFFVEGKTDYFALYLSADSSVNEEDYKKYKLRFGQLVEEYNQPAYQGMKEARRVKKIYKSTHSAMLNKYVVDISFPEIFRGGEYQCVTATMLYALVFDTLNIPYEIKELPAHVFLTAFPETHSITVETTNPVKGITVYDQQFKKNFIEYLRKNKLISQTEYDTTSLDKLFEKNYLGTEIVGEKQLAGLQYYNIALSQLKDLNYTTAFHLMEKAYFLHPNKRNSYLLLFSLALAIDHKNIADDDYAQFAGKLYRFHGKTISSDQLLAVFGRITERQLGYDGNTQLYDSSYYLIVNEIRDTALRKEVSFIYYYERGRMLYNRSRYVEAKPFLEKAYGLKQKNVDAENLFVASIMSGIDSRNTTGPAGEKILDELDGYSASYPNLGEQIQFQTFSLLICLDLMDNYYFSNRVDKAEFYRGRFEQGYQTADKNYPDINRSVPRPYATGAAYYFRKGRYKQAKEILLKGLEYTPDDYLLKSRLKALN